MTITEKLSRLKAVNIAKLFDQVLKENEGKILDMNRDQMYEEGVMNVNEPTVKEHYAKSTIRSKKRAPFPKTEFITLKWMGNFHQQLKLLIFRDTFVISSTNKIWANFLEPQSRFTSALGMTKESKEELRELSRDELIKKIKNVA